MGLDLSSRGEVPLLWTLSTTPNWQFLPMSTLPIPSSAEQIQPTSRATTWGDSDPRWIDLDQRIPSDHIVRDFHNAIRLLDFTALLQTYGRRGVTPYHPQRLLLLVLYLAHLGMNSPQQWFEEAIFDLRAQWLLRGDQPSRSIWYDFQKRLPEVLAVLNEQLVRRQIDEGQITGHEAALDGTTIAARASRHRTVNREQLLKQLQLLKASLPPDAQTPTPQNAPGDQPSRTDPIPATPEPVRSDPPTDPVTAHLDLDATPVVFTGPVVAADPVKKPRWMAGTEAGLRRQLAQREAALIELDRKLAVNAQRPSGKRLPAKNVRVSVIEPKTAIGRDKENIYRPFHNVQFLVDLNSPLILGYRLVDGASDCGLLESLLEQWQKTVPIRLLVVDSGYTSGSDLAAAERLGVTVLGHPAGVAHPGRPKKASAEPAKYDKSKFVWDAEGNRYVCPQEKALPFVEFRGKKQSTGEPVKVSIYRASPSDCSGCPVRDACKSAGAKSRSIQRGPHELSVEELKKRMQREESLAYTKRRGQTVERINADVKRHRNLRQVGGHGKALAEVSVGAAVLAHNLLASLRWITPGDQSSGASAASKGRLSLPLVCEATGR